MANVFSVLSWNVEHFGAKDRKTKKPKKPVQPIVDLIAAQKADVVAIYEVKSNVVFRYLVETMPDHRFFITEGPQVQEILVGVHKDLQTFATQKSEFKESQDKLRPGMMLTPYVDGEYYPLLFLHVKSMPDPKGFGLRAAMTQRALAFRDTLDKAAGGKANYIFMGDMNTMGMKYGDAGRANRRNPRRSVRDIDDLIAGEREIEEMRMDAGFVDMTLLEKTYENTYWSKSIGESNLDHVAAANHLAFKSFSRKPVRVSGWTDETTKKARKSWAKAYSDHALLYFEVQKV